LSLERDKLYCVLILPASGIVLEREELSDLPASKVLILNDAKRLLSTQPCQQWIETAAKTGLITIDRKTVQIKVEQ
jgi:hypothetical protein